MDAAGRMSVSDLTASLEGAILAEGKTPTGVYLGWGGGGGGLLSHIHQCCIHLLALFPGSPLRTSGACTNNHSSSGESLGT